MQGGEMQEESRYLIEQGLLAVQVPAPACGGEACISTPRACSSKDVPMQTSSLHCPRGVELW